jgi:hypothetical protein
MQDIYAEAVDKLLARGYRKTVDETSESFGDRRFVLKGEGVIIKLAQDRGSWFVEVALEEWDHGYNVEVWLACIDGTPILLHGLPMREKVGALLEHLPEIEQQASRAPTIHACLEEQTEQWLQRRRWAGVAGPERTSQQ